MIQNYTEIGLVTKQFRVAKRLTKPV